MPGTPTTNLNLATYAEGDAPDLTKQFNEDMAAIDAAVAAKQDALTLPLPIEQGGTGADNALDASANLKVLRGDKSDSASTPVNDLSSYLSAIVNSTDSGYYLRYNKVSNLKDYVLKDLQDPHEMIAVTATEAEGAATRLVTGHAPVEKGTVFAIAPNVATAANPQGYMLQFGNAASKPLVRVHDTGEASKIYTGEMSPEESYLIFFDGTECQVLNATPSKAGGSEYVLPVATEAAIGGVKVGFKPTGPSSYANYTESSYLPTFMTGNEIRVAAPAIAGKTGPAVNAGLMGADEWSKLNGIEAGANKYVLPAASPTVRGGVILANAKATSENTTYNVTYVNALEARIAALETKVAALEAKLTTTGATKLTVDQLKSAKVTTGGVVVKGA